MLRGLSSFHKTEVKETADGSYFRHSHADCSEDDQGSVVCILDPIRFLQW